MPTFAHFEILAVMVDRVQMRQVFMNLMLNAHRSREGFSRRAYGEVRTAGRSTPVLGQRQGRWLAQWSRWIGYFLRSLPTSRRAAAWGWPSAVPLCGSHGGQLWASANDGRGATFHFTLPIQVTESSPWLPKVFRSSSEYFFVEPAAISHFVILANCRQPVSITS
jgi:light-regulated signal transduction histidine kinase (bacteriophytochrome)